MTITGGCLCGAVRYTCESDPLLCVTCHCKNCQRQAGSALSVIIGVPEDAVSFEGALKTYNDTGDSGATLATADRIRDYSQAQGDRIQLDGIDAIAGGADDAFSFIGSGAFTGVAGQLRAVVSSGNTFVSGDVNGDGVADFLIRIDGVHTLVAGDFIL